MAMAELSKQSPKKRGGNPNWKKGQSANPGGRPKQHGDLRELARQHTKEAIQTLVEIMLNGVSEQARACAADKLLDRGWGRPAQALTGEGGEGDAKLVLQVITGVPRTD